MRKLTLIIIVLICFSACKSSKQAKSVTKRNPNTHKTKNTTNINTEKADDIINFAKTFGGVKYKYGGTTKKGMDCSGLVVTSFKSENVQLPRTTKDLATTGEWVAIKNVQKGDLLFFATKKNSRNVNHVAIVTNTRAGYVEFIHSTSSKGVIISVLSERYWYFSFVQARRIL